MSYCQSCADLLRERDKYRAMLVEIQDEAYERMDTVDDKAGRPMANIWMRLYQQIGHTIGWSDPERQPAPNTPLQEET